MLSLTLSRRIVKIANKVTQYDQLERRHPRHAVRESVGHPMKLAMVDVFFVKE